MAEGRRCIEVEIKDVKVNNDMSQFYWLVTQSLSVILCKDASTILVNLILWRDTYLDEPFFHDKSTPVLCWILSTPFTVKLSCEGKVYITIEILVNSKAALELAIRVSHIFTSDVVNPWEETAMVLSVDLDLLIFFWGSLVTIHIVNIVFWGRVDHLICVKVGVERVVVEVLYSPAIDKEL